MCQTQELLGDLTRQRIEALATVPSTHQALSVSLPLFWKPGLAPEQPPALRLLQAGALCFRTYPVLPTPPSPHKEALKAHAWTN